MNLNEDDHPIHPSTIGGINQLPEDEKRAIYSRVIPQKLLEIYDISPTLIDPQGNNLLELNCPAISSVVELSFYHRHGAQDPVMYGEITDTLNGQIHILFYTIRDPDGPRFDVDKMPDGTSTKMGTLCRNLEAEKAAIKAGLAPAQIRPGLRLLSEGIDAFENFVLSLEQTFFFSEPLHYHNAVILEHTGSHTSKDANSWSVFTPVLPLAAICSQDWIVPLHFASQRRRIACACAPGQYMMAS